MSRHFYLAVIGVLGCMHDIRSASQEMHWYRGNTHTHTSAPENSDANETPVFVAQWYRDHGYQFLVITDHENFTDVAPVNQQYGQAGKFLVLQGQEITQMVVDPQHPGGVRHAHVNGINTNHLIMPIAPEHPADKSQLAELEKRASDPAGESAASKMAATEALLIAYAATGVSMRRAFERNVAEVRAAGGLPQINHPNLQWSVQEADLLSLAGPYLFEVWNGYASSNNLGGDDEKGRRGLSAEALWDALLSKGKVVWGVGSDDSHAYHQFDDPDAPSPGKAWVVVRARELTMPAIVGALKAGEFYASTGVALESYEVNDTGITIRIQELPDWSPALKRVTRYDTRFVGKNGHILADVWGATPSYRFKGNEQYVRASILDSDGRRAWTQPVFKDGRRISE